MNQVTELKLKVIKQTCFISLTIIILTLIFGYSTFAFGLFYGTILAVLNWLLLSKTIEKSVTFSPQKAKFYAVFHYLLRFIILFIALYIAAMRQDMHILGAVLALLLPKIAILWEHVVMGFWRNNKQPNKETEKDTQDFDRCKNEGH